jgi:hypothetical protein
LLLSAAAHTCVGCVLPFVLVLFSPDGQKKAFVKLAPEYDVVELANKIGIV